MTEIIELNTASNEAMSMDLYFESILDQYSAPYRYIAHRARDKGSFIVQENSMLIPHIKDMVYSSQCPAVIRYLSMIEFKPKEDGYQINYLINL